MQPPNPVEAPFSVVGGQTMQYWKNEDGNITCLNPSGHPFANLSQ